MMSAPLRGDETCQWTLFGVPIWRGKYSEKKELWRGRNMKKEIGPTNVEKNMKNN